MSPPVEPQRRARRSPRLSDRALVLRRFRYRESSLVCHLLTPVHGLVSVLAKGAYRPKSAYSGVLDLFDTLELAWSPGRDLGGLRAGAIATRRRGVSRDLNRYRAGLRVLELARLGAREGHEEAALFRESEAALDSLSAGRSDPGLVTAVFDLKFLRVQGLAPALSHCAVCGERVREGGDPGKSGKKGKGRASASTFSPALGGRLCASCAAEVRAHSDPTRFRGRQRGRPLIEAHPTGALRMAESLLETPWRDLARIRLDPRRTEALRVFVGRFLEYHLETRPRVAGPKPKRASQPRASTPTDR